MTSSISGGSQFTLIQNTEATTSIWQETFEEDSATRDEWENASTVEETKWSLLQKNHKIINKDMNRLVTLAPDDSSNGKLPDPAQGNYAYWYGNGVAGSFLNKEASLLTEEGQPVETRLNGGTSAQAYYGTLTSPVIDLSTTQKPISLSFKTWWEIESVNPSSRGYDAMDVEVSVNGGEFKKLARLNPLSDPQTDYNRWSIPFSNFGFNLAPQFAQQEAISLDEYAGQSNVKIRMKKLIQGAIKKKIIQIIEKIESLKYILKMSMMYMIMRGQRKTQLAIGSQRQRKNIKTLALSIQA